MVRHRKALFAVAAVAAAIVVTCLTLNRYIKDADEAYQILNAQDWQNAPFAPLSALCGHIWGALLGFDWLSMRWLSMILNVCAIAIMGWWAGKTLKNPSRALWLTAGAILLYALTNDHEQKYDWDTFASFMLTGVAVLTMLYAAYPRWQTIAFAGLLASATALMRLPSASAIFVLVLAVIFCGERGKKLSHAAIAIGVWAVSLWLMLTLMYGGLNHYLQAVNDNAITSHSAAYLFETLFESGIVMGVYVAMFAIAVLVVKKCSSLPAILRICLKLSLIAVLTLGVEWNYDHSQLYDYPFCGLMAFALLLGVMHGSRKSRIDMTILAFCTLCAVAGSNCGFNRVMFYPLFPAVAAIIIIHWHGWAQRGISICFVAALIATLTIPQANIRVYLDGFNHEKYGMLSSDKARGVYFESSDVQWLEEVTPAIERYKAMADVHLTVCSEFVDGFVPEYICDTRNPITRHYWRMDVLRTEDSATIAAVQAIADSAADPSVIFMILSPAFDGSPRRNLAPFNPSIGRSNVAHIISCT